MTIHFSGPVLVGPDDVRDELWVVDGKITFARPGAGADGTVEGWVLPGLVDAHCHIGLVASGAADRATTEQQALDERGAGALLVRDAGQAGDTRWVDDRADLPKIIRAGRHIARAKRYQRYFGVDVEPDGLVAEVEVQAARGDGWVKLVGDWIDREVGDLTPLWPADVLPAAMAAAHRAGARVTAHCFSEDSIADLVNAGIDCIEHATGLTDETIPLLAERGVAIVPTLVNIALFPDFAAEGDRRFPRYAAHMRALYARRYDTIRNAYDAGIPVYCGTDAGGTLGHGLVAAEVAELVTAGLPPAVALDAAAWGARAWLGRDGLVEGADADLVVYPEDPRKDVRVLAAPTAIVLRGTAYPPKARELSSA